MNNTTKINSIMFHVYHNSVLSKLDDSCIINACMIPYGEFIKSFKECKLSRDVIKSDTDNIKYVTTYEALKSDYECWVYGNNTVYRCISLGNDKDSYSTIYFYFSHLYRQFALSSKLFTSDNSKIDLISLTKNDIDEKFILIKGDELVFKYTILYVNGSGFGYFKYYDHKEIVKCLKSYLIDNNTLLCHDQVFFLAFMDEETKSMHNIPFRINVIWYSDEKSKENIIKESMYKKGFRFDSILSQNVVFVPNVKTKKNDIYTDYEPVRDIKISWTYERDKDTNTSGPHNCNFIDQNILMKMILDRLIHCSFKVGMCGKIKKKSSIIEFYVEEVNGISDDDDDDNNELTKDIMQEIESKIYYIKYQSLDNKQTSIKYYESNSTHFDEKNISGINIVFQNDDENRNYLNNLDNLDNSDLYVTLKYEPTPNGNVVFIDSVLDTIPVDTLTIGIKCLSDISGNVIMWKKSYNKFVSDLLSQGNNKTQTLNNDDLQIDIDGMKFELMITDFTPRTHYLIDHDDYSASAGIHYQDGYTKLIFHAKYDNNSNTVDVIVCENDGTDYVVELECMINRVYNKQTITYNPNDLYLQLLQSQLSTVSNTTTTSNSDLIFLDEKQLRRDIFNFDYVWEDKKINIIAPQHNTSLSLTYQKIVWNNNNDLNVKNKKSIYIGKLDILKTKIKWIYEQNIYVILKENSYHEKSKGDIIDWTQKNKIGGLNDVIWNIYCHLVVLRNPETIDMLNQNGMKPSKGVVLYGPPGNGKTKLARSIGKLLGSRDEHIILKSGTELLSKWLGESEKNVAKLFEPAENAYALFGNRAPLYTIIIDEIDIIAQQRGTYGDCTGARDGMVNQLLTKLDGLTEVDNVILIGLTNREKTLDIALLREGRLDRKIYIGQPTLEGRKQILDLYMSPWLNEEDQKDKDNCINDLVEHMNNFSGADTQGYIGFVIKEYWSEILGSTITIDKRYVPMVKFRSMIDVFKKEKNYIQKDQ